MVKWMDITICGWNVVITCQRKISQKIGMEYLEQQQNEPAYRLQERTGDIKRRAAELRKGLAETDYIHSLRREQVVEVEKRDKKENTSSEMDKLKAKLKSNSHKNKHK